jgi:cell division transport system ATP-binding protein
MAEAVAQSVQTVVRFENVGLRYDVGPEVLQDVTFDLTPGSFHFLIGESGAGKSSLLKLAYLALRPTRGRIFLFEQDVATVGRDVMPKLRREIGVVFQEFRLLDHLSAFDNVALPLRVAGARRSEIKTDVAELLAWVGLKDHLKAKPPTLSGGQKQRVAIARAIVHRPSVLIADEPTGNVDDRMAIRLMHLFEELNRMGTTVVVATHNQALVERLNHPRLILDSGRLTQSGPGGRAQTHERIRVGAGDPAADDGADPRALI